MVKNKFSLKVQNISIKRFGFSLPFTPSDSSTISASTATQSLCPWDTSKFSNLEEHKILKCLDWAKGPEIEGRFVTLLILSLIYFHGFLIRPASFLWLFQVTLISSTFWSTPVDLPSFTFLEWKRTEEMQETSLYPE